MYPRQRPAFSRREVLIVTGHLTLSGDIVMAQTGKNGKCVIVQAGRRVDAETAETAQFASTNINLVRERIKNKFLEHKPLALVTSAACGTDLLALEDAERMNIERFILLPSPPAEFRAGSVT